MNMLVSTAALSSSSPIAHAEENPDAEIIQLVDLLKDLEEQYQVLNADFERIMSQVREQLPELPEVLRHRSYDGFNVRYITKKHKDGTRSDWLSLFDLEDKRNEKQGQWQLGSDEVSFKLEEMWDSDNSKPFSQFEHLFVFEPNAVLQARYDAAVAAMDTHNALKNALKEKLGLRDAETRVNKLYFERMEPAEDRLLSLEAKTLTGLRAKALYLTRKYFEDQNEEEMTVQDRLISEIVEGVTKLVA